MRQKLKSIAIKRANELFFFQMFAHCAATVVNDVPIFREFNESVSTTYFRYFFFEESRWHEQRLDPYQKCFFVFCYFYPTRYPSQK